MSKEAKKEAAKKEPEAKKEAAKKESTVKVSRDTIALVAPGLYQYEHKGDLTECKEPEAFKCAQSKNYGVRVGDVIICKNDKEATLVVVK